MICRDRSKQWLKDGLGIHFVKNMSNHYIYSRIKDCNVVDIFIEAKGYCEK